MPPSAPWHTLCAFLLRNGVLCDAELAGASASVRGRVSKQTICAGSRKSLSVSEAARDFVDETMESMELATRINGFHLNRDAWVCRNDTLRRKVNHMLAMGSPTRA